jgi:WhiB family redox-sensing transcriptional regulator
MTGPRDLAALVAAIEVREPTPAAVSGFVAWLFQAGRSTSELWRMYAACRGEDAVHFFTPGADAVARAKAVCRRCPVASDCLDYALDVNEPFGIWGGLTEAERARVARHRRRGDDEPPYEHPAAGSAGA